jgi:hypothetical protein
MFFAELAFAFVIALLLLVVFLPVFGWRRPARQGGTSGLTVLFVLLFLFVWFGGVYAAPLGPVLFDVYWVPFVLVGVLYLLLVLAIVPPHEATRRDSFERSPEAETERSEAAIGAFGAFFWVLAILLVVALIANYAIIAA